MSWTIFVDLCFHLLRLLLFTPGVLVQFGVSCFVDYFVLFPLTCDMPFWCFRFSFTFTPGIQQQYSFHPFCLHPFFAYSSVGELFRLILFVFYVLVSWEGLSSWDVSVGHSHYRVLWASGSVGFVGISMCVECHFDLSAALRL